MYALALAGALLSYPEQAHAVPPGRVLLRNYGGEQGLVNANAVDVVQDAAGYLWAGTQDGVYRYDGQRFERFGGEEGLSSDFTSALYYSPSERLWVGSLKGLAYLEGQRFQSLGAAQSTPIEHVSQITSFRETGAIWVAMKGQPLLVGSEAGFKPAPDWPAGIATALAASRDPRRMWVAATVSAPEGQTRVIRSYAGGAWREWPLPKSATEAEIEAIAEDALGRLWIRLDRQLWRLDAPDGTPHVVFDTIAAPNLKAKLSLDAHGRLLIPSSVGLARVTGEHLEALGANYEPPLPWSFTAFEDREGSLWIGGLGLGLNRVLGRGAWQNWTTKQGLPSDLVWSVLRDQRANIWVGTQTGLAVGTDAGWKPFEETKTYQIISVLETPGAVWAAGKPRALFRFDAATERLERFDTAEANSSDYVLSMAFHAGRLWIGSTSGLSYVDPADASVSEHAETLPASIESAKFYRLAAGKDGRLWASTSNGLALREQGHWFVFTREDGLLTNNVYSTLETGDGRVLTTAADAHGVSEFRYQPPGKLQLVHHPDGTRAADGARVYSLTEDARGQIWIGTGRGLVLRGSAGDEHFGLRDGLVSEDFSPSAAVDPNGDVWFGTSGALLRFNAAEYRGPLPPPRIELRGAWLGSEALGTFAAPSPTGRERSDAFRVKFGTLRFIGEGQIEYQTRLNGFEAEWQTAPNTDVLYAALPPGNYAFEARARVAPGGWGEASSIAFQILPRWYQTLWFRILVGVLGVGLVFLLVRVRMRALQRKNLALEELVRARTQEVAAANRELTAANTNMRLVLDTVDQGLVMIDARGALTLERSKAFTAWFGDTPARDHFAERICDDPDSAASLKLNFQQLMEGKLPLELAIEQMPKELTRDGNHYALSYKPVVQGEAIESTLLTVSNVTSQFEARRLDALQREQLAAFTRIVRDRAGFIEFLAEADALVARIREDRFSDADARLRSIHTLKGSAGLFDASSVAAAAHALEQTLLDADVELAAQAKRQLLKEWADYRERVLPLVGDAQAARIDILPKEVDALVALTNGNAKLGRVLASLHGEPIRARLARIEDQVRSLSKRLGKGDADVHLAGDDVWLPTEPYAAFWSDFSHVVRNAVDHGFQLPHERRAAGKAECNRVDLKICVTAQHLEVEFRDDGRGIDWERVRAQAAQAGLAHATEADLSAALFAPHLTTTASPTATSGRGFGMFAISKACETLGGSVTISSVAGQGTALHFSLPLAPSKTN